MESRLKKLFLSAQSGNAGDYEVLLKEISILLRGYLFKTMSPRFRSAEQVEDLIQEVLISIHRKRDLYDVEYPFLPWVYAIAKYRLIDSLRMVARRPECVEWVEKFDALAFVEIPKFAEEEDGEEILKRLNVKQKEVLKLAKVDEVPLADIASKMGMSLSAVKVTIHRSIKILRGEK